MKCVLSDLFLYSVGEPHLFYTQVILLVMAFILGTMLTWSPRRAIELQIAFYRLINWKMEPISMKREIRNTRIMGIIVLAVGIFLLIYMIMQK